MKLFFPSSTQATLPRSLCASWVHRAGKQQQQLLLRRNLRDDSRKYYVSAARRDDNNHSAWEQTQALPLGGFYEDLLATPLQQAAQTRQTEIPEPTKSSGPKIFYGAERKYRGGTSATPDSTWRTVNGVPIPPRPAEPDNCCMSGCIHCVWDDYRDEVEGWAVRLRQAQAKAAGEGTSGSPKVGISRPEVADASVSMDDDGGGSETLWQSTSTTLTPGEDLFQGIPVGIREFMATEKRLRDRKKKRKTLDNSYDQISG